jgi:hypothetical protein
MNQLENIVNKLKEFRNDRDWSQFHNSKDLSIALSIETNELLEEFEKKFDEYYKNDFEGLTVKYPISFDKIIRMYKNVLTNGFTSYAEA